MPHAENHDTDDGRTGMKLFRTLLFIVLVVMLVGAYATNAAAQTLVSGQIDGRVTDPTGAVVPNATVNLVSGETGFNGAATSDAEGVFHFSLLKPGNYTLSATKAGFRTTKRSVVVALGQTI